MKKVTKEIPIDVIEDFGECHVCGSNRVEFMHLADTHKEVRKLAREAFRFKDGFVRFCPECEDMGFIK